MLKPDELVRASENGEMDAALRRMLQPEAPGAGCRVAVIVTAYNQPAYVQEAIASVRAQTLQEIVCVVVDDGSADATGDAARAAIGDDERFRLVQQANAGCSAAREAGLQAIASGVDSVLWLDGDDMLMPDALEVLAEYLNDPNNRDAPAVAGLALPIDQAGKLLPRTGQYGFYHRWIPGRIPLGTYRDIWYLMTPGTTLWRRSAVESARPYPPGVWKNGEDLRCEDVQIACLVTAAHGPIGGLSVPTLLKREGVGWCAADGARLQRAVVAYKEWVDAFCDAHNCPQELEVSDAGT